MSITVPPPSGTPSAATGAIAVEGNPEGMLGSNGALSGVKGAPVVDVAGAITETDGTVPAVEERGAVEDEE